MEVSHLSVIPDSDEGAWSGNHGICLVLGRIFPSVEIDFFVFGAKARLFLSFRRFRFDAIRFTGARGGMDSGSFAQARPE